MSRNYVMMMLCVGLVLCHAAMDTNRVTVDAASVETSSAVRGGATTCAIDLPGGWCWATSPEAECQDQACTLIVVTTTNIAGNVSTTFSHSCQEVGKIRFRWFWSVCTYMSTPPFFSFPSTTCGPPTPGKCFQMKPCEGCGPVAGVMMCKIKIPAPNLPIFAGFFEESAGDQVSCSIDLYAAEKRPRSTIAFVLPSFREVN